MVQIGPAAPSDTERIRDLLITSRLPAERLDADVEFFVARQQGTTELAGCVGLERYGGSGLLRSLAVDAAHRGRGISRQLIEALLDRARELDLTEIIILTTDAVDYFRRIGFAVIPREDVDPAVRNSWQFAAQVCESAACLRLVLGSGARTLR